MKIKEKALLWREMSKYFTDQSQTAASDSDSAETPPQLAQFGLCRVSKMSKMSESQRFLRSKAADKDDELFVKLPKFSKRLRGREQAEEENVPLASPTQKLYKYLKQPHCQRWIWCEFIESFIDKAIVASAYDMSRYMLTCFPQLQTRHLPRRSWQLIRRNMGKARRFSPAFIAGERVELERSRRIVRLLQQRKFDVKQNCTSLELMPKQIPMPLAVDTKVISLLGEPLWALCKGRVVGYEPKDSSYMVKYDLLGKHTVLSMQDCLLYTLQESESLPLLSIIQETEKQKMAYCKSADGDEATMLLNALLRLQKLLEIKRKTVQDMTIMNEELETNTVPPSVSRREAKGTPQRERLQRRYATNMITLHRVNADILEPLRIVHSHLTDYEKDAQLQKGIPRNKLYEKCRALAEMDMKAVSCQIDVQTEGTRELILQLQTLLYLCGEFGRGNTVELNAVIDDFVRNMLICFPQLNTEINQIIAMLQPLREHILSLSNAEAENGRESLQTQQPDAVNIVLNEELHVEMGL